MVFAPIEPGVFFHYYGLYCLCSKLNSRKDQIPQLSCANFKSDEIWYDPIQSPYPLSRQGAPKLTLYIGY